MKTAIVDVLTIGIPVGDQERALAFFVERLGFEKRLDAQAGDAGRWLTVAAPGAATDLALVADPAGAGRGTGIRFSVPDAAAEHAAMAAAGVEVGALLRWPGVPAMFEFQDVDGNRFTVLEAASR